MARIVLERTFDPETGRAEFERSGQELERCLETRRIKPIRSTVAADYRFAFCEFDAPDADSVRSALRQAGIRFERVWTATVIDWQSSSDR